VKATLIDYGAGNVTSVARALQKLEAEVEITNRAAEIAAAKCLLLPGVGHCGALIAAMDRHGLRDAVRGAVGRGTPLLGICLGLQAFYAGSDEAGELCGLEMLEGRVTRLPEQVKLPHMGWNQVRATKKSRLLDGIPADAYFYFAHSYAAPAGGDETVARCEHGREFAAVLERGNLFGVQFHPEKSGEAGARLLRNFLRLAA
jgi:imidazole glycerol-phosphate synthase subunit HisH